MLLFSSWPPLSTFSQAMGNKIQDHACEFFFHKTISQHSSVPAILHSEHRQWLQRQFRVIAASFTATIHFQEAGVIDTLFDLFLDHFPQPYYSQCEDAGERMFIASCIKKVRIHHIFTVVSTSLRRWKSICAGLLGARVRRSRRGTVKRTIGNRVGWMGSKPFTQVAHATPKRRATKFLI